MAARLPEALADCLEEGLCAPSQSSPSTASSSWPCSAEQLPHHHRREEIKHCRRAGLGALQYGEGGGGRGGGERHGGDADSWVPAVWKFKLSPSEEEEGIGEEEEIVHAMCTFVRPLIPIKFYVRFWSTTRDLNLAFRRLVGVLVRCQSPSVPSYLKLKLAWQSLSCRVRHSP